MSNPSAERGKRAEREVVRLVAELTGWQLRRTLAGRTDDAGDVYGLPDCTVQVKGYTDPRRGMADALAELPAQQRNAGTTFAAAFVRRRGGQYAVVMAPDVFLAMLREATGPATTDRPDERAPFELADGDDPLHTHRLPFPAEV